MAVSHAAAKEFTGELIKVVKRLHAAKQHLPRIHTIVDSTMYPVLFAIREQPQRVSTVATQVHSDISTVSRQVTMLVKADLAEKVDDPDDGRAQVVRLTPSGEQALADLMDARSQWMGSLLQDWTTAEVRQFTEYLQRFGNDLGEELDRRTDTPQRKDHHA